MPRLGLNVGSVERLVDELVAIAEQLFDGIPLVRGAEAPRQASLAAIRRGLGWRGRKLAVKAKRIYKKSSLARKRQPPAPKVKGASVPRSNESSAPVVKVVHPRAIEPTPGEGRIPRPGLNAGSVEQLVDRLVAAPEPLFDGIPDFPLDHEAEARRQASLAAIRDGLGTRGHKLVVVAHLYYRDLVPEILEHLANIPEGFDLVVTMPDWGNCKIVELVRTVYPDALLYPAVNRGRDIGPFLDVLPAVLEHDYDAILHLQTKAGYFRSGRLRRDLGELWRGQALDALLGGPERVTAILDAFRTDPAVHEVGPQPHYLSLETYPYHDGGELGELLLGETPAEGFFAGTMFWARPDVFRPLVKSGALTLTSVAEETGANDGALAHLVERLFGHAALADGGVVLGAPVDPAEPLITDLQPLAVTIHEHMEAALAAKQEARKAGARGALAW